jgi:hypothetical protein
MGRGGIGLSTDDVERGDVWPVDRERGLTLQETDERDRLLAGQSVPPSPSPGCGAYLMDDSSSTAHRNRTPGGTSRYLPFYHSSTPEERKTRRVFSDETALGVHGDA